MAWAGLVVWLPESIGGSQQRVISLVQAAIAQASRTHHRRISPLRIVPKLSVTIDTSSPMSVNANMIACYYKPGCVILEFDMI
jgi:hypothetical protein